MAGESVADHGTLNCERRGYAGRAKGGDYGVRDTEISERLI
jgi:hypothetical protein